MESFSPSFDLDAYRNLYPFESNFLDLDGVRMHYLDEGKGETVLMLHGNPTWSFYYRNLILALRKKYRVIAPDHIGCGLSDKPQRYPYQLSRHVSNVQNLLDELKLKKVHLIVHDWGGMIGFGAAVENPERFQSFVILNTGAFRLPQPNNFPLSIAFCRVPALGRFAVRVFNGFSKGASMLATVSSKVSEQEKQGLMAPYNSYANRVAIHAFVKDIPLNPSHPSYETLLQIESRLHLLENHPKQVIWGKKDFCFDDHFLREWKRFFPGISVVELPEAGHYVLEDAREEVIQIAGDFLGQVKSQKPAETNRSKVTRKESAKKR